MQFLSEKFRVKWKVATEILALFCILDTPMLNNVGINVIHLCVLCFSPVSSLEQYPSNYCIAVIHVPSLTTI